MHGGNTHTRAFLHNFQKPMIAAACEAMRRELITLPCGGALEHSELQRWATQVAVLAAEADGTGDAAGIAAVQDVMDTLVATQLGNPLQQWAAANEAVVTILAPYMAPLARIAAVRKRLLQEYLQFVRPWRRNTADADASVGASVHLAAERRAAEWDRRRFAESRVAKDAARDAALRMVADTNLQTTAAAQRCRTSFVRRCVQQWRCAGRRNRDAMPVALLLKSPETPSSYYWKAFEPKMLRDARWAGPVGSRFSAGQRGYLADQLQALNWNLGRTGADVPTKIVQLTHAGHVVVNETLAPGSVLLSGPLQEAALNAAARVPGCLLVVEVATRYAVWYGVLHVGHDFGDTYAPHKMRRAEDGLGVPLGRPGSASASSAIVLPGTKNEVHVDAGATIMHKSLFSEVATVRLVQLPPPRHFVLTGVPADMTLEDVMAAVAAHGTTHVFQQGQRLPWLGPDVVLTKSVPPACARASGTDVEFSCDLGPRGEAVGSVFGTAAGVSAAGAGSADVTAAVYADEEVVCMLCFSGIVAVPGELNAAGATCSKTDCGAAFHVQCLRQHAGSSAVLREASAVDTSTTCPLCETDMCIV